MTDDDLNDYDPDDDGCQECGGEGWIITCCDDLCHGAGYCIHGDGMEPCVCNTGDPPSNAPANWRWRPQRRGRR